MYYDIAIFFTICCRTYRMHCQYYGSENFPNTIVLLKVDRLGFSNRSNIDKLVIKNEWM